MQNPQNSALRTTLQSDYHGTIEVRTSTTLQLACHLATFSHKQNVHGQVTS